MYTTMLYGKFVGRLLYGFRSNQDPFWNKHYVFWGWFLISQSQSVGLFALNEILLNDLYGMGLNTDFLNLDTGIRQIDAILPMLFYFLPFGAFNYLYFVKGKRYLSFIEDYKNEKMSIVWMGIFPYVFALGCVIVIAFAKT